jgi:hypothetical protein
MRYRLFAALIALSFLCTVPAQAAFPDHVRAMIFNMLGTLPDMPGLLKHDRDHNDDSVAIGFKRGDLHYLFVYLGGYRLHYPEGPKPLAEDGVRTTQWDQPELRLIPQERRRLRIFVSSKGPIDMGYQDSEYLLQDLGLSGKISFAEYLIPYQPTGRPLNEEEWEKWKREKKEYSNHSCCKRLGLEYDAHWQELYDQALENGLEFYEQYWKPVRASRIPR